MAKPDPCAVKLLEARSMCCQVALMHGHKWLEPDELLWRLHPKWFLQDSPLQLGKRFLCTCGKSGSAGRSTALLNSLMMYWYIMIYSKYYLESIIQKNTILWCIQTVDMVREFTRIQIHVLSSCSDARGQVAWAGWVALKAASNVIPAWLTYHIKAKRYEKMQMRALWSCFWLANSLIDVTSSQEIFPWRRFLYRFW